MLTRLFAIFVLTTGIAFGQARTQTPQIRGGQASQAREYATGPEAFAYASAFIDSLGWAKSGQSRVGPPDSADFTQFLYNTKLANQDYEKGAASVASFSKSPVESIQVSSEATQDVFASVMDANKKTILLITSVMDGKGPTGAGTLANQVTDNMVQVDSAWKLLVSASIATTFALLEPDAAANLMQLNITSEQRDQLAKKLGDTFGADKLKDGLKAGQFPVEGAAAILYSHLKKEWKTRTP